MSVYSNRTVILLNTLINLFAKANTQTYTSCVIIYFSLLTDYPSTSWCMYACYLRVPHYTYLSFLIIIDSSVINFPFNKNDTGEVEPSSRLVISPTRSMPWPVVANSTTTTTCTSTTTTTTTRTTTSSTTYTTTTTRTTYTTTTTTTTTTATATTTTTKTSTRTTTSTTTYTTTSTTTSTSTSTYTTSSSRWGLMPVITPRVSPIGYFPATTTQIILTGTLSPSVTASASSTSATPQSDSTTIKATHSTDAGVVPTACTPTTTSKVTESPEMLSDGVTGCVIGSIASCVFIGCLILLFWEKKRSNTTQGMNAV